MQVAYPSQFRLIFRGKYQTIINSHPSHSRIKHTISIYFFINNIWLSFTMKLKKNLLNIDHGQQRRRFILYAVVVVT